MFGDIEIDKNLAIIKFFLKTKIKSYGDEFTKK